MRQHAHATDDSCRQHRQIEQPRSTRQRSGHAKLQRCACSSACHMGMPSLFKNFTVRHVGGAGGFTGQTANAIFRVFRSPGFGFKSPFRFFTPQSQPTARRIVFVARELIGRAHFQTQPAMHAVGEQVAFVDFWRTVGRSRQSCGHCCLSGRGD